MSDKYHALTNNGIFADSSYQLLVNPRNRRLEKEGITSYSVFDNYLVERKSKKKCVQYLYDTTEWCVLTDKTSDDTWACTTTDLINTFDTLATVESRNEYNLKEKRKQQILNAIKSV